jgi:hypothetical protein
MSFANNYPEYKAIEHHIRRAHAERSVYIAHLLADGIVATGRGLKQLWAGLVHGAKIERDAHAMQVDALFKKRVPRY